MPERNRSVHTANDHPYVAVGLVVVVETYRVGLAVRVGNTTNLDGTNTIFLRDAGGRTQLRQRVAVPSEDTAFQGGFFLGNNNLAYL